MQTHFVDSLIMFHLFKVISIILFFQLQAEGFVCESTIVPNAPDLAKKIKFPDGRTFYILGQNHGDRMELRRILALSGQKSSPTADIETGLRAVLNSNKDAVLTAHKETSFIKDLLEKDPDIKFLGLEATNKFPEDHLKYSKVVQENLNQRFVDTKFSLLKHEAFVGFSGSITYLKITEPGLLRTREIFGYEDQAASESHGKQRDNYDKALAVVKLAATEDTEFLKLIRETDYEFLMLAEVYTPELDQKLIEYIKTKVPEKYLAVTINWVQVALAEIKAMYLRDKKSVENIISKQSSAVVTVGRAHAGHMASEFVEKCKLQLKKEPAQPKKPAKTVVDQTR